MKIYLVRHGESEHNVDRFLMAHTHDAQHALTEKGQEQANITAEFMKGEIGENAVFYVSPYRRTMETADPIYAQMSSSIPFYENPLIREWELGNLYDFNYRPEHIKKEFKAAGAFYFRYHNGESFADLYLRASMFMNTVIQRIEMMKKYEQVVVVTHAAFIQAFKGFVMNWPVEKMTEFQSVENASVTLIEEHDAEYTYDKIFVPEVLSKKV